MSIRADGLKEALALFRELGAGGWSKNVLDSYGRELTSQTKPYPSKPPRSKYIRTMNLFRQWYSQANNTQVEIGNRADYSGYVQQRATQAWFHRQHGWPTIEDRAESAKMDMFLIRKIKSEVDKILRRHG